MPKSSIADHSKVTQGRKLEPRKWKASRSNCVDRDVFLCNSWPATGQGFQPLLADGCQHQKCAAHAEHEREREAAHLQSYPETYVNASALARTETCQNRQRESGGKCEVAFFNLVIEVCYWLTVCTITPQGTPLLFSLPRLKPPQKSNKQC